MIFQPRKLVRSLGFSSLPATPRSIRNLLLLGLLVAAAGLSGCTSTKEYSITSYQGPMPLSDIGSAKDLSN